MERARSVPPLQDDEAELGVFSPAMHEVVALARQVAERDSNVLITGETGVGKERLAQLIHHTSPRSAGPFVAVNCGALSETLVDSELFGHARGAFTGALQDRSGLFESAHGGTLLLDEVGDAPAWMQVKLLRALQEHEVRRVGENRPRRVDVRVIAATNRNLKGDVDTGRFRQDLYFRLKVVELCIPPLRERPDDLRGLSGLLLTRVALRFRSAIAGYTEAALEHLMNYPWPGNIRELENAIERACTFARGALIDVGDLPNELRPDPMPVNTPSSIRPLRDIEREYIMAALHSNRGNRRQTAEQLRITAATLFRKLKTYRTANLTDQLSLDLPHS